MFDPLAYPYVRAQTYVDGGGAVLADEFYNPTEDALARLFGAQMGLSTSISVEEFDKRTSVVSTAGLAFGQQLWIDNIIPSANVQATTAAALAAGDAGVWLASSLGGACLFVAYDAPCYLGTADFIWTCRVRTSGLARLATVANGGVVIGLANDAVLPNFIAGKDQPNWQYQIAGTVTDSGVAVADGTWYVLIIARKAGTVTWYIKSGSGALAAVGSAAYAVGITSARRYIQFTDTAGTSLVGDGLFVDSISRGFAR